VIILERFGLRWQDQGGSQLSVARCPKFRAARGFQQRRRGGGEAAPPEQRRHRCPQLPMRSQVSSVPVLLLQGQLQRVNQPEVSELAQPSPPARPALTNASASCDGRSESGDRRGGAAGSSGDEHERSLFGRLRCA